MSKPDPDVHKGAVEGDRPGDTQHSNRNAPRLNKQGLPSDPVAIAAEQVGVNVDDKEVSQASETGRSTDHLRDEESPLE